MDQSLKHKSAKKGSVQKRLLDSERSLKESDLIPILEDIYKKTGYRILGHKESVPFEVSGYSFDFRPYQEKCQFYSQKNYDHFSGQIISPGSMDRLEFYLESFEDGYGIVLRGPERNFKRAEAVMKRNIEDCVKEYLSENKD